MHTFCFLSLFGGWQCSQVPQLTSPSGSGNLTNGNGDDTGMKDCLGCKRVPKSVKSGVRLGICESVPLTTRMSNGQADDVRVLDDCLLVMLDRFQESALLLHVQLGLGLHQYVILLNTQGLAKQSYKRPTNKQRDKLAKKIDKCNS